MKFTTTAGEQLGTILLTVTDGGGDYKFVLTTGEAKNLGFKLSEGIAKAALKLGEQYPAQHEHAGCSGGFCRPMGVEDAERRHHQIALERAEEQS